MANRTRNIVLRVPVTPEERALIQQKMAQLHTKNFSAYARKMLIDGYIVHMDTSDIRAQTAELQKIGVNVNQIARRINSSLLQPHNHLREDILRHIHHCIWKKSAHHTLTVYPDNQRPNQSKSGQR